MIKDIYASAECRYIARDLDQIPSIDLRKAKYKASGPVSRKYAVMEIPARYVVRATPNGITR
jgi:hypothetical protein